jgi:hypothetical protein
MSTAVNLSDLHQALDWVSSAGAFENAAYIRRDTGEIFWASDPDDFDIELPADIDDQTRYVSIPHKNDLGLGRGLVARFVENRCPDHYEAVRDFFRARGAYSRFKGLMEEVGLLEAWYEYETRETEQALREWLEENEFETVAEGSVS